jgi:hypothetical protein
VPAKVRSSQCGSDCKKNPASYLARFVVKHIALVFASPDKFALFVIGVYLAIMCGDFAMPPGWFWSFPRNALLNA